jgi:antirestriction protein ArdC
MLFFMAILALLSRAGKAQKSNLEESMSSNEANPAEKKTTAQELIAANIQALIEQLKAGKSDALTAYLDAMSRFHRYSFGNVLAIARQRPGATNVAGFHAWRQLGRYVRKGERGICILAPIITKRKQREEPEQGDTQPRRPRLAGFRNAYVFDVSQTEGKELPTIRGISGDVGENRERLFAFLERQGIELFYAEDIAPALGMSYGGKIALLPGQSKAEEFSTLVHEVAHELLHRTERRAVTTKVMRETEAEAVAFIVGKAVGLDIGTAASDYIQLYDGDAALLTESLQFIQHASSLILAALEPEQSEAPSDCGEAQLAEAC